MADRGWQRSFDDPISLPDGRQLVTLDDTGDYITLLPKAEQQLDEWQTAIECLMLVVKLGGPTMFARKRSIVTPNARSFARPDIFDQVSVELRQKPTRNRGFFHWSDSNIKDGAGIGAGTNVEAGGDL